METMDRSKAHDAGLQPGAPADGSARRNGLRETEMVMNTSRFEVQPAYPDTVGSTSGTGRGEHEKGIQGGVMVDGLVRPPS
jgi:hypothetical protein